MTIQRIGSLFILAALLAAPSFAGGQNEGRPAGTSSGVTAAADRPTPRGGNNAAPLAPLPAAAALPDDQARFDSFVKSVDWLKANRAQVIVLDARSKAEYDAEHITGAVQAHWRDWSNVAVAQGEPGWSVLLPPEVLAQKLAALGIDGSKPVVIYNDPLKGWGEEGRQLWSLRVAGLTNTFVLNGGLSAWKAAGGAVDAQAVTPVAVAAPRLTYDPAYIATTDYIAARLDNLKLLDVREPEEYLGEKVYGERQKGRIPGARHTWFKDFYNADGTLQTPAQLRARFVSQGLELNDPVVAYCTGGIRSGFSTIALRVAGYRDVRNYDASFSEWAGTSQVIEN